MRLQVRSLILILLSLAFAFGVYKYYGEDEQPESRASIDHNLKANDITINVFNPLGELTFKVFTEELSVFNQKDFYFQQILAYRNPNNGQSPFLLRSDKAHYRSKIVNFLAQSQVFPIAGSFNGFKEANFTASTFNTKTMILDSNQPIHIIGDNYRSDAQGFTFNFKTESYELRDAQTQYILAGDNLIEDSAENDIQQDNTSAKKASVTESANPEPASTSSTTSNSSAP